MGTTAAGKVIHDANLDGAWPVYLFLMLSLAGLAAALWRKPIAAWLATASALAITFSYAGLPGDEPGALRLRIHAQRGGEVAARGAAGAGGV